jgi:hypothetical protein
MADWTGWEADVLAQGNWPDTPQNVRFLQDWHTYEESSCNNNPLNTTLTTSTSTVCNSAGVKNYPTTTAGAKATADTLGEAYYFAIAAALKTGDPYSVADSATVAQQITTWGTPNYASFYLTQVGGGQSGAAASPQATASVFAPGALSGWADFRNSVNSHLPTQMARAQALRNATLKTLGAKAKVG